MKHGRSRPRKSFEELPKELQRAVIKRRAERQQRRIDALKAEVKEVRRELERKKSLDPDTGGSSGF